MTSCACIVPPSPWSTNPDGSDHNFATDLLSFQMSGNDQLPYPSNSRVPVNNNLPTGWLENRDKDHCVHNFCGKCVSNVDVNGRIRCCQDCDAKFSPSKIINNAMATCPPWPTILFPIMKRVSHSQRASLISHYDSYLKQQLGVTEAANVRVREASLPKNSLRVPVGDFMFDPWVHANLCNNNGCFCQVQGKVNRLIETITELMENCVTDPPFVSMFKRLLAEWYQAKTKNQKHRWVGNCNYVKQLMALMKKIKVYHKLHKAKDEEARKQEEAKLEKQRLLLHRKLLEVVCDCVCSLQDSPLTYNPKEKKQDGFLSTPKVLQ